MRLPLWFTHALLIMLIVHVGIAYSTGTSPVFALIGIIAAAFSILVRQLVRTKA